MHTTLTKEEQIIGLLRGDIWDRLEKEVKDQIQYIAQTGQYLTITKQDIFEYVKEKGVDTFCSITASTGDGQYFIEEQGKYTVYSQERGASSDKQTFDTFDEALRYVIEKWFGIYSLK